MTENTENQIILCSCGSTEHQMVISHFPDEGKEVYVHIHLNHLSFWKRLGLGLKYIFGYTSKYGHWDEMILNNSHVKQLKEIIKVLDDKILMSDEDKKIFLNGLLNPDEPNEELKNAKRKYDEQ